MKNSNKTISGEQWLRQRAMFAYIAQEINKDHGAARLKLVHAL